MSTILLRVCLRCDSNANLNCRRVLFCPVELQRQNSHKRQSAMFSASTRSASMLIDTVHRKPGCKYLRCSYGTFRMSISNHLFGFHSGISNTTEFAPTEMARINTLDFCCITSSVVIFINHDQDVMSFYSSQFRRSFHMVDQHLQLIVHV